MGVEAIDKINRSLQDSLSYLKSGVENEEVIRVRSKNVKAVLYTIEKASNDLEFLSRSLKNKGVGESGIASALKRAFYGLFGGF